MTLDQIVLGTGSGELLKIAGLLAMNPAPGGDLVAARPTYEELPAFRRGVGDDVRLGRTRRPHRHDLRRDAPAGRDEQTASSISAIPITRPARPWHASALDAFVKSFRRVRSSRRRGVYGFCRPAWCRIAVGPLNSRAEPDRPADFFEDPWARRTEDRLCDHRPHSPSIGELSLTWPNSAGLAAATASLNDHRS